MRAQQNKGIRFRMFAVAMVLVFITALSIERAQVHAAELLSRSVSIGSSFASDITNHVFTISSAGPSTVQSIQFQYCVNSPLFVDACIAPTGIDVTAFTINSQSGITGFSPSAATTNSAIVLNRASSVVPGMTSSYDFGNLQNPSVANTTYFVRIAMYDGPDATGTRVDQGAVAFVLEDPFQVQAFVPPYLTFCVGITVSLNCSSTTGALATFGELSQLSASTATSQFSVSTNDQDGYNTFINGQTMTSGNNIINPLTVQTPSNPGASQFGINLRLNSAPSIGADPDVGAVASGIVDPSYNVPNFYRFNDGDRVALSTLPTGFNRFTVSYVVNIPNGQAPGVYASTLTYTAIASF